MAKIDVISLVEMTALDGSVVLSGATVKFETQFFIGSTTIEFRPRTYRSILLYESGLEPVRVSEIPNDYFRIQLPEAEFYSITPLILYEKVKDYLNNYTGGESFMVISTI